MKTLILIQKNLLQNIDFKYLKSHIKDLRIVLIITTTPNQDLKIYPDLDHVYFANKSAESTDVLHILSLEDLKNIFQIEINTLFQRGGKPEDLKIFCADEANVLNVGLLREYFGMPGPGYNQLKIFRDKIIMKECIARCGVRVPKFAQLDFAQIACNPFSYYNNLLKNFGKIFVLKPNDSGGSFGIYIIKNYKDFTLYLESYKILFPHNHVEYGVEEFIGGELYHTDTVVSKKNVVFSQACKYLYPNFEFQKGKPLASIPLKNSDPVHHQLIQFVHKILAGLGWPEGSQHTEIFINEKNELIFLELAARPPGMLVDEMYKKSVGMSIPMVEILSALELSIDIHEQAIIPTFWAAFPMQEGILESYTPPKFRGTIDFQMFVEKNYSMRQARSNLDFCATMLVSNNDYSALYEDFEQLRSINLCEVKDQ